MEAWLPLMVGILGPTFELYGHRTKGKMESDLLPPIWLWNAGDSRLLEVEQIETQFVLRRQFRQDFGYVLASAEVVEVLADLLQKVGHKCSVLKNSPG